MPGGLFVSQSSAGTPSPRNVPVKSEPTNERDDLYDEDSEADGEAGLQADEDGYTPVEKLPYSVHKEFSIWNIYTYANTELLDLDAEYQRDVVWTEPKVVGLIDSIEKGHYVPPLLFNVEYIDHPQGERRADGSIKKVVKRTVVDGKQRITAITKFMNGEVHFKDGAGVRWYYQNRIGPDGLEVHSNRRILSDEWKQQFRNKKLMVHEFTQLTLEQQRDVFARVQEGAPLLIAEKIFATDGPWQRYAKKILQDFPETTKLAKSARAIDFRNVLAAMMQVHEVDKPTSSRGVPTFVGVSKRLQLFCKENHEYGPDLSIRMTRVFQAMDKLRLQYPETFQNNAYKAVRTFSPIEFIGVAVILWLYLDSRSLKLLSKDILYVRRELRNVYKDLKNNNNTWKDVWSLIQGIESQRGAVPYVREEQPRNPFQNDDAIEDRMADNNVHSMDIDTPQRAHPSRAPPPKPTPSKVTKSNPTSKSRMGPPSAPRSNGATHSANPLKHEPSQPPSTLIPLRGQFTTGANASSPVLANTTSSRPDSTPTTTPGGNMRSSLRQQSVDLDAPLRGARALQQKRKRGYSAVSVEDGGD